MSKRYGILGQASPAAATFAAAYPSVDSILGAFNNLAAGGGA
jgi:hypothetical protein